MENIKDELKTLVQDCMIPESEGYLEELLELLKKKEATPDDIEAIKDMESFLVELQNILVSIEQDKITDEDAKTVYDKINAMLEAHDDEDH